MTSRLPDDSVQAYESPWWISDGSRDLRRGRLVWAFFPFIDVKPIALVATGRKNALDHSGAKYQVQTFEQASKPRAPPMPPVAALPVGRAELLLAQTGKRRPGLVLSGGGHGIPNGLASVEWQRARSFTAAPYFGADQDGSRAGWSEKFVKRIRHFDYPQYMFESLPLSGAAGSILRLDQALSMSPDWIPDPNDITEYRLSDKALEYLDELEWWLRNNTLPKDGRVLTFRSEIDALMNLA